MGMYRYLLVCMVMYGYGGVCMGRYGYVWVCMDMYGYVWVCMGMYGYIWVCMGMYGYVWVYMGMYGYIKGFQWMKNVEMSKYSDLPLFLTSNYDLKGNKNCDLSPFFGVFGGYLKVKISYILKQNINDITVFDSE